MKLTSTTHDQLVLDVRSRAFSSQAAIPADYTCDGRNVNPPLAISGIPKEAKSLALIVDDPDAAPDAWLHWLVWNIPVTKNIDENVIPGEEGMNDFGRVNYGGPCPPSGTHRYFFRVYALDAWLDLDAGATRRQLEEAMEGHRIAYGELVGVYQRNKAR